MPAVRIARTLDAKAAIAPTGGSLAVAKKGGDLVGTMVVQRPDSTQTLYLTNLKYGGASRGADVHSGSATGPKVGTFKGTVVDGELAGTVTVGATSTDVTFKVPTA